MQILNPDSVERRAGSQAAELKSHQAVSREPDGTEQRQTDAEGAVSQSHCCSISSALRDGNRTTEFLMIGGLASTQKTLNGESHRHPLREGDP